MTAPIRQRVPGLPREDRARRPKLSIHDRDDVAVVSLCGEPDLSGASGPRAQLSGIQGQGQPPFVADLTGLAFINCACLSVLAIPVGPRSCGVPLVHTARSRVISEVSMSYESVVGAGRGPRHGGGAVPAPGWLS